MALTPSSRKTVLEFGAPLTVTCIDLAGLLIPPVWKKFGCCTPGVNVSALWKLRPLIGRFCSCWLVVCVCTAAVSVWSRTASADTTTDSCSVPTASRASTRTAVLSRTAMSCARNV